MNNVTILGPNGTPYVELGGERAWLQRVTGDIVVSYQWLDVGEKEPSPCMVLFAASRRCLAGAYVIPQKNAHYFADNRGRPTTHLLLAGRNAIQQMGFDANDRATVKRAIDIIVDGLADLVRMPSDQPGALHIDCIVRGIEARAKVGDKVFHQEVL